MVSRAWPSGWIVNCLADASVIRPIGRPSRSVRFHPLAINYRCHDDIQAYLPSQRRRVELSEPSDSLQGLQTRVFHRTPSFAGIGWIGDTPAAPSLKLWKQSPSPGGERVFRQHFDKIFGLRTGYKELDELLARLARRKDELLRVLERPEIPLHTNASENDLRAWVIKRKISGGTMSADGRVARDVMLGLSKTCRKLGLSFFTLSRGPARTEPRSARIPAARRPCHPSSLRPAACNLLC